MKNYLVTGVGGDIAQGIIRIIRESDLGINIIGCDINNKNAGSLFVDKFKLVNPAKEGKRYIKTIKALTIEFDVDVIIPSTESEVEILSNIDKSYLDCMVINPGKKVIDICTNKYKTNSFLRSIGLKVPWTNYSSDKYPDNYPCIFKANKGTGSKLLFVVDNIKEAEYLAKKYKNTIFQELLLPDDYEVTCAVFRKKDGQIRVLQMKRKLTGGFTSWAKVIYDAEIENTCKYVAKELNLEGSMNIQLRKTNNGPRIFEINPRFSSTVYMRHLIGFEDFIWSIKDIMGEKLKFTDIAIGTELVRTQGAKVLKVNTKN